MATANPIPQSFDSKDIERLRTLVPLHTLDDRAFDELLATVQVSQLKKGALLFRQGDTDHVSYYLLSGRVALLTGEHVVDSLEADSEKARFPVAHVLPRKQSARAASKVRVARLDSRKISDLLARAHTSSYQVEVVDEGKSGDWMSLMLQSPILQQVPASNIQRVMMNVDQVDMHKGEDVIRQGDPGDYYFMLIRGQALVTRDMGDGKPPAELARLAPGDAFGEEALLSDSPRNSTISMLSDGQVLRLAKDDFIDLIQTPLSSSINFDSAVKKVEQGAVWLDLRSSDDYEQEHLPGSINLPVESLRYQVGSLAPDRHYVLCSHSGGRAQVAAFLLTERGFDVSVLAGGLAALNKQAVEAVSAAPAQESTGADELQRRVEEAEQRARELEQRLRDAEQSVNSAEAERRQQFDHVKGTVSRARERLLASEKEKQAALQAQQKAYNEMETLTSNLEQLESERARLSDRMLEIEGLDKQLQKRLQKAERELIGERERAETANASLDELDQRLSEVIEEREAERERHAQENGALKEEMTVLQLELEQTRMDMDDLRSRKQADQQAGGEAQEQLQKLREEAAKNLQLLDTLQEEAREYGELLAQRDLDIDRLVEQVGGVKGQLAEQQQRLQEELSQREELQRQLLQEQARAQRQAERQAELESAGAQQEQELAHLQRELQQAGEQLTEQTVQREQLQQQLEQEQTRAQRQSEQQAQELEQLQQQLAQTLTQREALQLRQTEDEATIAQQQGQLDELARQQDESAEKTEQLAAEHRQALQAANGELAAAQAQIESSQAESESLRESLEQTSAQLQERQARLEQQTGADADELSTAREQLAQTQRELAELHSSRDQDQARLKALQSELEQAGVAARDTAGEGAGLEELQGELDQARANNDSLRSQLDIRSAQADTLQAQLAARQDEVDQLRSVMETYVEQIKNVQGDPDELQALRSELEMVREQAVKDVAQMRERLSATEQELRQLRDEDGREALEVESMRQQLTELGDSLAERQRDLASAEEARQLLEDSLEDANTEVDTLRRELDKLAVEKDESSFRSEEAEAARLQVQDELLRYQRLAEQEKVNDLRDERMRPPRRPLDIDKVAGNGGIGSKLLMLVVGGAVALGALEALSFLAGGGELIGSLLK